MEKNYERYFDSNIHIISSTDHGLVYDVPTNTIFKISSKAANKLKLLQRKNIDDFKTILEKRLISNPTTLPSHSYWWNTKIISKLTFNVTSKCNLRCKYCYAGFGQYDGYSQENMSASHAVQYIDALVKMGISQIKCVQFFGGEPLLSINTVETICKYFTQLKETSIIKSVPVFTMITNLTSDNKLIYDVISKYNIQLTVSIDGPKEIHDMQRVFPNQTGSYSIIEKNINILKKYVVSIEATYTLNHVNHNMTIEDLRTYLAEKYHLSKGSVFIVPVVGVPKLEVPSNSSFLQKSSTLVTNEDSNVLFSLFPDKQTDLFCSAGFSSLSIMPNGDFYPCHMYAVNKNYCLGNLLKPFDFKFIRKQLNNLPLKSRFNYEKCISCWARKFCHICPAQSLISNPKEPFPISDFFCSKRKLHYEDILLQTLFYTRR